MPDTTGRLALPYPSADRSDPFQVAEDIAALAQRIDAVAASADQGTLGARPAAGSARRLYFATDDNGGTLYYDTGAAWLAVPLPLVWHTIGAAGEPTFIGPWGGTARYARDNRGLAYLSGAPTWNQGVSPLAAGFGGWFTLPAGYRPAASSTFAQTVRLASGAYATAFVTVGADGIVTEAADTGPGGAAYGGSSWFLDGIVFRVA